MLGIPWGGGSKKETKEKDKKNLGGEKERMMRNRTREGKQA
jgi:hypothetical protein